MNKCSKVVGTVGGGGGKVVTVGGTAADPVAPVTDPRGGLLKKCSKVVVETVREGKSGTDGGNSDPAIPVTDPRVGSLKNKNRESSLKFSETTCSPSYPSKTINTSKRSHNPHSKTKSSLLEEGKIHVVAPPTNDSFVFNPSTMDSNLFIYEVPHLKFWTLSSKQQSDLVSLGALHPKRMSYMSKLIVVPQSLKDTCITICDNGKLPHYQVSADELNHFRATINKTHLHVKIRQATSHTEYVKIFQSSFLKEKLPWKEWIEFLHTHGEKPSASDSRQQALYMDFGYTSNVSTARTSESASDGTAIPLMKPSTEKLRDDFECAHGVRSANQFLEKMVDDGLATAQIFGMPKNRIDQFARRLPGRGRSEALRLNISVSKSRTGPHQDCQNDPEFPHFVSFSQIFYDEITGLWVRVSLILYTRQSIGDYYKRREVMGNVVRDLIRFYNDSDEYRKTPRVHPPANKRRFSGRRFGVKCYGRPCGFDPGTYLGSSVHALTCMTLHFNLDYVEALSALRAFTYMGFSPFFFVNACHLIMGMGQKHPPAKGTQFGLFILQLMMDLRKANVDEGIPGFRYGASGSIPADAELPDATEWDMQCKEMMRAHLHAFTDDPGRNPQKTYDRLERKIVSTLSYCGDLGSHHAIAFASIMGLLPFWMLGYVRVNAQGRPQRCIAEKYGYHSRKDVVDNLRISTCFTFNKSLFKHDPRLRVTVRFCENLECKFYRCLLSKAAEGDRRFHDLQMETQFDVQIMFHGLVKLHYKGDTATIDDSLFKTWFYDGGHVTPAEMARRDGDLSRMNLFLWSSQRQRETTKRVPPAWKDIISYECLQPVQIRPVENLQLVRNAYESFARAVNRQQTLSRNHSPKSTKRHQKDRIL